MYFVFVRLYSSSPQPPSQCSAPTCHLSILLKHCIVGVCPQSTYRVEMQWGGGECIFPISWSVHCSFECDSKYSERGSRSPGIDSKEAIPQTYICSLAETISCNRFLGSLNDYKFELWRASTTTLFQLSS
jgi:hypothetical protein